MRKGYYTHVNWVKVSNVAEYFDKDGADFLESAFLNQHFFRDPDVREALQQAAWNSPDPDHRCDLPSFFNLACERFTKLHPEWFESPYDHDLPFDEIQNDSKRLEKRVEHLSKKLYKLFDSFFENQDEEDNAASSTTSRLESMQSNLQLVNYRIQRISDTLGQVWIYVGVGALIGFVLGRYVS